MIPCCCVLVWKDDHQNEKRTQRGEGSCCVLGRLGGSPKEITRLQWNSAQPRNLKDFHLHVGRNTPTRTAPLFRISPATDTVLAAPHHIGDNPSSAANLDDCVCWVQHDANRCDYRTNSQSQIMRLSAVCFRCDFRNKSNHGEDRPSLDQNPTRSDAARKSGSPGRAPWHSEQHHVEDNERHSRYPARRDSQSSQLFQRPHRHQRTA